MRILQRDFRDDKESTLREIYAVVHELDNGNFSRESSGVGGFPFFKFFRKEWRENMAINGPELKEIISDDARLFLGAAIPDAYLTDALGRLHGEAEALVFPTSTEEVSQILRYAHAHSSGRGTASDFAEEDRRSEHHLCAAPPEICRWATRDL